MASEPFEPLAGIVTPAELALRNQAETNTRYLRAQSIGGQAGGFASLGVLLGQGLEKLGGYVDPEEAIAKRNEQILNTANQAGADEQDPFERQAIVLKTASDQFRRDGNFQTSAKLDTALLQLKKQQLEMNKLSAETAGVNLDVNKKVTEAPYTKENILSQINERNTSTANLQSQIVDRDAKPISFFKQNGVDSEGKPVMATAVARAGDSAKIIDLVNQGYQPVTYSAQGPSLKDFGTGDNTKATDTSLEKVIIDSQNQLDNLGQVARKFDPSYLGYASRIKNWGKDILSQAGVLPASQVAGLQAYTAFRQATVSSLNDYIHQITGATVGKDEAPRLLDAMPTGNESVPVFSEKLRGVVHKLIQFQARAQDARKNGLLANPDTLTHLALPTISDDQVDAFLGPAFSRNAGQASPGSESGSGTPKITPAPQEALDYLKANPQTSSQFKSTFGYLPE